MRIVNEISLISIHDGNKQGNDIMLGNISKDKKAQLNGVMMLALKVAKVDR